MRGRFLLGLSNANRQAAGVEIGDEVEVELEFDAEPRVVAAPADFARALGADPIARAAYERLPEGRKREHLRAIESAKKPETRTRRIEKAWPRCGTRSRQRAPRPAGGSELRNRRPAGTKLDDSLQRTAMVEGRRFESTRSRSERRSFRYETCVTVVEDR
jgi:Bacteriocin-protection, YdeI or OmpD-Associated